MSEAALVAIRELIAQCTPEELAALFRELRARHLIHEFEEVIGASAEMILEAVHRAPELTRRMLRGVIADAAFRQFVVVPLTVGGWHDVTPIGNFAFDYKVDDGQGAMTVQVKLQRSERGAPVVKRGERYGFGDSVHIVETQKTRTGTDGEENQTRPYRYGDFDILAVSMQPSTAMWDRYMYTLGRWLLPVDVVFRPNRRCRTVDRKARCALQSACACSPRESATCPSPARWLLAKPQRFASSNMRSLPASTSPRSTRVPRLLQ